VPAEIQRVMIGRIDLITPQQRELAAQYRAIPNDQLSSPQAQQLLKSLGRFAGVILNNTPAPAAPITPLGAAR
jgi:hypothetical protein